MNRYQFEVLTYIEKNGKKDYPMRTLSDTLKISGTAISKALDELENDVLIKRCEDQMEITEKGLEAIPRKESGYYGSRIWFKNGSCYIRQTKANGCC